MVDDEGCGALVVALVGCCGGLVGCGLVCGLENDFKSCLLE